MSAKFTEADLAQAKRWLTEDVDPFSHWSFGGNFPDAEDIAGLIADVREECAAKCDDGTDLGKHYVARIRFRSGS